MYIIGYITLSYMVEHDRLSQTLNVNQINRNREKKTQLLKYLTVFNEYYSFFFSRYVYLSVCNRKSLNSIHHILV